MTLPLGQVIMTAIAQIISDHIRGGRENSMLHGFRFPGRGCLCHDSFQGVFAACCLSGKHHRIGAVPNGIAQVRNFGSCWYRCFDHRLDHLRGCNHEEPSILCLSNEKLLCEGHAVESKLNTKIPAGNHQGLRLLDDSFDVGQRLRLLNLRANLRPLLSRDLQPVHDVDELLQVLGLLSEGDADVLDRRIQLQQELGILDVFDSEGCTIDLDVRHVHALPGFEFASPDHFYLQLRVANLLSDDHLHDAVLNQQGRANLAALDQGVLLCRRLHSDASRLDVVIVIDTDSELQDLAVH
mmetsp:Transcript_129875/g.183158  ORF Transcript_129875/g.183158 Transcript_129875/m.183158 type:complete len:296 (+) Transcript_129875:56-943(+)